MSLIRNYAAFLIFIRFLLEGGLGYAQSASQWHYRFDGTEDTRPSDDVLVPWSVHQDGRQGPLPLEQAGRRWIIGRFGNTVLQGRFAVPEGADAVEVRIGLHVIGSWDGVLDNDRWLVRINGAEVFDETFSNTTFRQSYPARRPGKDYPQRTGAWSKNILPYRYREHGVYDGVLDAFYMLTFTRPLDEPVIVVELEGRLQDVRPGITNESWAISLVELRLLDYWAPPPAAPERSDTTDTQLPGVAGYPVEEFPGLMMPTIQWFPFRIVFGTSKR